MILIIYLRTKAAVFKLWPRGPQEDPQKISELRIGPGALGRPRGSGWRGRWEGGSGWGTHVNPWLFHFNV